MPALPTGNELGRLPLRAVVAYAGRCAQRVVHFAQIDAGTSDSEAASSILESAIDLALKFAVGEDIDQSDAEETEEAVVQAILASLEDNAASRQSAFAGNAAYAAVNALVTALASRSAPSRPTTAMKAVMAAVTAADAAVAAHPYVHHSMIRDWSRLSRMSLGSFPEFGRSFDPTEKGPLGPVYIARRSGKESRRSRLVPQ
jgi:hypothetical protein